MTAYYNEHDKHAAQWLRNLIEAGHVAPGIVDERSIEDITPGDLAGFTQCHFFAGVGVWSLALRRAGWRDDQRVWTGSCPCQPFSAAGKGDGFADERHLWPAWFHLIGQCNPPVVYGEQVASSDATAWIDLVQTDMEALGYAFGAIPFPSAGVGAPHIRDRLYWVGNAKSARPQGRSCAIGREQRQDGQTCARGAPGGVGISACDRPEVRRDIYGELPGQGSSEGRNFSGMADTDASLGWTSAARGHDGNRSHAGWAKGAGYVEGCDSASGMADTDGGQRESCSAQPDQRTVAQSDGTLQASRSTGPTNGHWRDADWLLCRDGKWRPVEPGTLPLAHGAPARVGRLRAYGNAINAQAAQIFIEATKP